MKIRNIDIAILVLTVAACAIPFLGQPFHMDDNLYMDMARNAQKNPFFPNDTPYVFQGIFWPDLGSHSHPLFQTYFLAGIQHFFGEGPGKERFYHLPALIFPIIAVLSFYGICARFVERPLWPSMLLACSPLFLVMQHNLMTDVPMLAFWLAAICFFLWATHLRHKGLYISSAVFQFAAIFTSYQSIALLPLLGFYQLRRGRGRAGWISLAVAPAAIVAWYVVNCFHYRRPLWGFTLGYIHSRSPLSLEALGTKLISILEYQGWLMVFPFFILYLLARDMKWRSLAATALGALYVAQFVVPGYSWTEKAIFVVGLTAGCFVVLEMGKVGWSAFFKGRETIGIEGTDGQFLGLWYFGFFAYCLFFLTEGSARYILPMLPPFLLCFFRVLEISEVLEYRLPRRLMNSAMLASGSLVVSLMWGLALSRADQEFARIYPRAAVEISRITDSMRSFVIGEWGLRYYSGRRGVQPMPVDTSLVRGGDFIAVPKLALPTAVPPDLRSLLIPIRSMSYKPDTPLRVLDWQTPAAFYSTGWGLIPFSFSRRILEEIEVFQVNFMAERLPWAQIESSSGVKPWPGYPSVPQEPRLSIMAKPGTRIRYDWPVRNAVRLGVECGVSRESYRDGSDETFEFEICQLERNGSVLAQQRLTLWPGNRNEDRGWKPALLKLKEAPDGVLEFRFRSSGAGPAEIGAFANSAIRPVE
jgi:4-amino-4-deoxy-L-arabinose transferase-like glycosyltransferase